MEQTGILSTAERRKAGNSAPQSTLILQDPTQRRLRNPGNRAFTLMEIVIVIIIIGLLMGAAAGYLVGLIGYGESVRVQSDLKSYQTALQLYRSTTGRFPTTAQGLKSLAAKPTQPPVPTRWQPFMQALNKDPWNQDYVYVYPGKRNPGSYDLYSKGQDPDDPSDDLGNWRTAQEDPLFSQD